MALILNLIVLTGLFLAANVTYNSPKIEESLVGKFLKDVGGLEYAVLAYEQVATASNKSARWISENAPVYLKTSKEYFSDYIRLGKDLSLVAYNISNKTANHVIHYVRTNYPIVENWYVVYIGLSLLPGPIPSIIQATYLIEHIKSILPNTKTTENVPKLRQGMYEVGTKVVEYGGLAMETSVSYTTSAVQYVKTNVLVGDYSSENIQKYAVNTYEKAQGLALNTVSWVFERVQNLTK